MKTLEELTGFWLEQVACEEGKIIASVFSHGTETSCQEVGLAEICCCPHCYLAVESEPEPEPKRADKPPIGLRPRKFIIQDRVLEIIGAMSRYTKASKEIPVDWIRELEERIVELIAFHHPVRPREV